MTERWEDGHVDVSGTRLHFTRTGRGGQPLVLAHGITGSGRTWSDLATVLEADFDVVMYDARGHGQSAKPEQGYSYEALAGDLAGVIRGLELGTAMVAGHSMGAATAAVAGAAYPELIERLVLEDPPWRTDEGKPERRQAAADSWHRSMVETQSIDRDARIRQLARARPSWSDEERASCADAERDFSLDVFEIVKTRMPPWRDTVAGLRCPTLLVTADPEAGAIVSPQVAAQAEALCDSLRVVRFEGAGHNIRREAGERYATAVGAFLRE